MKVLIVGLGSMGLRHARLIDRHFPDYEIYALRRGDSLSFPFVKNLFSWQEVQEAKPNVALICSPTYLHIQQAMKCASMGMSLFIEKPISCSLNGLDGLLKIVEKNFVTVYVAYPFRHHIGFNALKRKFKKGNVKSAIFVCMTDILSWGKSSYSFARETGGGVILELSHEIDIAEYLFGTIVELSGDLSFFNLEDRFAFNMEKSAKLKAIHESGAISEFVLDLGSMINVRFLQYVEDGVVKSYEYKAIDGMYIEQLRYFFANLGNPKLDNNIFDAAELFKKMIAVRNGKN